jgi:hypothetical protein
VLGRGGGRERRCHRWAPLVAVDKSGGSYGRGKEGGGEG